MFAKQYVNVNYPDLMTQLKSYNHVETILIDLSDDKLTIIFLQLGSAIFVHEKGVTLMAAENCWRSRGGGGLVEPKNIAYEEFPTVTI